MQAIKEKINDLKEMRKAKAEAKEEERAEREMAKSRLEVAHEVRMAKEAEAAMDLHVQKAAEKAAEHEKKFPSSTHGSGRQSDDFSGHDSHGLNSTASDGGYSTHSGDFYGGGAASDSGHDTAFLDAPASPFKSNAARPTHNRLH